jgi:hypothetical protein
MILIQNLLKLKKNFLHYNRSQDCPTSFHFLFYNEINRRNSDARDQANNCEGIVEEYRCRHHDEATRI